MNTILALSGLILVAAATPGPNNFAVMEIARTRGLRAATTAIMAVVLGGLVLLVLTQLGLDAAVARQHALRRVIMIAGAGYLGYLGANVVYQSFRPIGPDSGAGRSLPRSAATLFALQFANPKAWLLIVTSAAAAHGRGGFHSAATMTLIGLLTVIPGGCLVAWALAGRAMTRYAQAVGNPAWVARVMGTLLIFSAASLIAR
jgi:threonine/homoserine/homoserine lactone efflux protein